MQSPTRYALSIILLSSVVSSSYYSSAKLRRDGVLNLYPFPRVGRSSSHTWQTRDVDINPVPNKRQLYAFPRVGRNEPRPSEEYQLPPQLEELLFGRRKPLVKRQSLELAAEDSPGMWFGPRLGRSLRNGDDDISQNDPEKTEPEQLGNTNMDREKRQTKYT